MYRNTKKIRSCVHSVDTHMSVEVTADMFIMRHPVDIHACVCVRLFPFLMVSHIHSLDTHTYTRTRTRTQEHTYTCKHKTHTRNMCMRVCVCVYMDTARGVPVVGFAVVGW